MARNQKRYRLSDLQHTAKPGGIECPRCGCRHWKVVYTRQKNNQIMRLRQCRHCGRRLITREKAGGPATGA